MTYISYVNLFHAIACFILTNLALIFSINVLFRKSVLRKSVNISPTITVYFIYIFIWAILSEFYFAYLLIFWRLEEGIYNAYWLYGTGLGPSPFLTVNSIAETFLCIERCISLMFPLRYAKFEKYCFAAGTLLGLVAIIGVVIYVNDYLSFIPEDPETTCQFFGCLIGKTNKYMYYVKILFNIINIIFAIVLGILIKYTLNANSKSVKQMNKTVALLIASTTFIELLPFIAAQAFLIIYNQQLYTFLGSYGTTAISLNITLSAAIYYKAFRKSPGHLSNSKVTMLTTTTAAGK